MRCQCRLRIGAKLLDGFVTHFVGGGQSRREVRRESVDPFSGVEILRVGQCLGEGGDVGEDFGGLVVVEVVGGGAAAVGAGVGGEGLAEEFEDGAGWFEVDHC